MQLARSRYRSLLKDIEKQNMVELESARAQHSSHVAKIKMYNEKRLDAAIQDHDKVCMYGCMYVCMYGCIHV